MKTLYKDNFTSQKVYWGIIIISVLIGAIIRFSGLGTWSLALDEYYIIKSSENILIHGLPQFPNGGYYMRGILLQYMIASLISIGIKAELAGRIFSVIASLITIPALFLIVKKFVNYLIATVVIIIFSFSIWEIEFARFARMYTPFQAIFMWYIYFALTDYKSKNFEVYKWMLVLSAISIFVYEGSVFLAAFNFIPFILYRKIRLKFLFGAVIVFFTAVFINMFDFRTLNSNPIFPPDYVANALFSSPIKLPKVLLPFAFDNLFSSVLAVLLIGINSILLFKIIMSLQKKNFWSVLSLLVLAVSALLNQFGLFVLLFVLVIFWKLLELNLSKKNILLLSSIFIINFVFWFAFGLLSDNWYSLFDDFSSFSTWGISKRLLVGFLNFPDNYYSFYNYCKTLPLLTSFSAVLSAVFIIRLFKCDKDNTNLKFIYGSLIFFTLLATLPTLLYEETRYTFFEVPLLLIAVIYAVFYLTKKILNGYPQYHSLVFVFITMSVFIFSRDFNLYHLMNIDSQDVNYRMIYTNNVYKKHLYRRWDTKTPTDFVKKHLNDDDIIMINENSQEYYLPRVDYFSFDYRHQAFSTLSVNYGQRERWSNAKLIYNNKDLINFIENRKSTIWFVVYPENYLKDIDFYERYKDYLVSQGIDGMIKVFKFPKPKIISQS